MLQRADLLPKALAQSSRWSLLGDDSCPAQAAAKGYQAQYLLATIASLCVVLAFVGLQVRRGEIYYEYWMQEIFIPLEGVLHLQHGHRPYVDFSTPVGIFHLLPHYLAARLAGLSGMTVIYANALVGALAFALAALAGIGRLPPSFAGLLSLYVGLTAISPRWLGLSFDNVLYIASYNRWGWSFFCILCLVSCLPRLKGSSTRGCDLDGFLTGFLLFLLFHLKATYFLVGAVLVMISLLTVRRAHARRYSAITLASFLLLMLVMELATGVTLPYMKELKTGAAAQPGFRLLYFLDIAYYTYYDGLLVLLVGLGSAGRMTDRLLPKFALLVTIVSAGVVAAAQNNKAFEIPIIPVATLIAFFLFWPSRADAARNRLLHGLLYGAIALVFLKPIAGDSAGLLWASLKAAERGTDSAWLQGTPLHDLVVREWPNPLRSGENKGPNCCGRDSEYLYVLSDGVELLRDHHISAPATVFSLTYTSPFPTLLGLTPVKHNLLWWDPKRTFSATVKPSGEVLFKNVDYVLIPKVDMDLHPKRLMLEIYAKELASMFTPIDESRYWILLAKR
jgi:hypothetical protein